MTEPTRLDDLLNEIAAGDFDEGFDELHAAVRDRRETLRAVTVAKNRRSLKAGAEVRVKDESNMRNKAMDGQVIGKIALGGVKRTRAVVQLNDEAAEAFGYLPRFEGDEPEASFPMSELEAV